MIPMLQNTSANPPIPKGFMENITRVAQQMKEHGLQPPEAKDPMAIIRSILSGQSSQRQQSPMGQGYGGGMGVMQPHQGMGIEDRVRAFLRAVGGRETSGYRSPEHQAQLYQGALAKYGSPQAARKWVAPPGRSMHNRWLGTGAGAYDLDVPQRPDIDAIARQYGLYRPMPWEKWHFQPEEDLSLGVRQR